MEAYHPGTELERKVGEDLDWEALDEKRRGRVREMLEGAEPLPGVRKILIEAQALGIPCTVASSSPSEWVVPWLERLGIAGAFVSVRCLEHVHRPKPAPDLFLRAAEDMRLAPREAMVLEDSLNGLAAARAAGSPCVIVANEVTGHLDFDGATLKLDSLRSMSLREILGEVTGRAFQW
jgi:putative hydrolase of the HAD superfamily